MRLMLWSAPRSRSTAFFRMMAERGDFTVVHEPFSYLVMYGHTDVGGTRVRSGPDLIRALLELPGQVFVKETTGVRYATGIPFVCEALSWDPAQRPEWQPSRRWHETVAVSSGLGAVSSESATVPDAVAARYLRRHLPYYEALHARRLTPA
jgi:hypothetical protein